DLFKADVYQYATGIKFIVLPPATLNAVFDFEPDFKQVLQEYRDAFGEDLSIAASKMYSGDDSKKLYRIAQLSSQLNIPMVATNDVHYHALHRRELQDVMTCVREKCTIYNAGFR